MDKLATVLPGCCLEMRKLPDCFKNCPNLIKASIHLPSIETHQTASSVCNSCKPNVFVLILFCNFKGINFVCKY